MNLLFTIYYLLFFKESFVRGASVSKVLLNFFIFAQIKKNCVEKYAIIVAGGKGDRMQRELPKQFLTIGGTPILMRTIEAFYRYQQGIKIVLVLPKSQFELWAELCEKHQFNLPYQLTEGGQTRFHSVQNGLALVPQNTLVAVHDGVRPFVSAETIENCYNMAAIKGAVIPTIEAVDSIRFFDEKGNKSVNRSLYRMVQTPQVFESTLLKQAYTQHYTSLFTDDASVVEAQGHSIFIVDGNRENIKITTPYDLIIGEAIYANISDCK